MPYLNFWKVASYFWILPFLLFFSVFVGYAASSPLNELILMEQIIQLVKETVLLIVLVTLITLIISVPAAIVTGLFDFFGKSFFSWALCLPLAFPIYIYAFIFVGFFESVPSLHDFLRGNIWVSAIIISMGLFPYTFLLCRVQIRNLGVPLFKTAQTLGHSNLSSILKIVLPALRPAIIAGSTLAAFEVLADLGGVSTLGIQTITVGIFDVWFGYGDLNSSTKLSLLLFLFALLIFAMGSFLGATQKNIAISSGKSSHQPLKLNKTKSLLVFGFCLILFVLTFVLPFLQLVLWSFQGNFESVFNLLGNSITLGILVSLLTAFIGVILALSAARKKSILINLSVAGYAIPGAVIAIALLIVGNIFFNTSITNFGLLGLALCLIIRFLTPLFRYVSSALQGMAESSKKALLTLPTSSLQAFLQIYFPVIKPSLMVGVLIVFIEVMKEQPATLLLRPIGFDTLSSKIYNFTFEGQWELAATPSIILIIFSSVAVLLLYKEMNKNE